VVAILRAGQLIANPKSVTVFQPDDRIGLIGDKEEIHAAEKLLTESDVHDLTVGGGQQAQ
jgi:CPA2 family monovalent cation:H+ antiporter-2